MRKIIHALALCAIIWAELVKARRLAAEPEPEPIERTLLRENMLERGRSLTASPW